MHFSLIRRGMARFIVPLCALALVFGGAGVATVAATHGQAMHAQHAAPQQARLCVGLATC